MMIGRLRVQICALAIFSPLFLVPEPALASDNRVQYAQLEHESSRRISRYELKLKQPSAPEAAQPEISGPLSFRRAFAGRLGRLGVYGALFIAIGAVGISVIVVPRLHKMHSGNGDAYPTVLDGMALSVGVVAGFLLAVAILARTLLQYSDAWEGDPSLSLPQYLTTPEGRALAISTILGALVAVSSALARSHRSSGFWRGIQILCMLAFVYVWGLSGHAANVDRFPLAPAIMMVHVISAGLWIGMLSVIFVTVLPVALRDTARVPLLRATIMAFSGVALVSAGMMVLTGFLQELIYVGSPLNLPYSLYGRTLMMKIGVVLVLLGIGAYNWRVLRLQIHSVAGALRLRNTIRLELLLAAVVLIITAVLVVTVPPK